MQLRALRITWHSAQLFGHRKNFILIYLNTLYKQYTARALDVPILCIIIIV